MVLVSVLKFIGIALSTVVVAPIVVVTAPLDRYGRLAYRACQAWGLTNLVLSGVRVRVQRTTHLDPRTPYVFMANHVSHFDSLAVIMALADFQLRWVAKLELTRVPVFGLALRHAKHIIIDRSNRERAVESLSAACAPMRDGISVVIFPEGTRGHDGELLPLKLGGFMLALEAGAPIVPIVIRGSEAILPRGSWHVAAGVIDVLIGPPIAVVGVDREELVRRVRAFMLEHLEPAQPRPAAVGM